MWIFSATDPLLRATPAVRFLELRRICTQMVVKLSIELEWGTRSDDAAERNS